MSICNECWGKGWIEKQGVQFDCHKCKGTGVIENEPLTNDEWRRTCSAEEFSEWLEDKMTWAAQEQGTFTAKGWEKWLKQPHTIKE